MAKTKVPLRVGRQLTVRDKGQTLLRALLHSIIIHSQEICLSEGSTGTRRTPTVHWPTKPEPV